MSAPRHGLVVVGAGPAGIAAASEAARQGVKPLLIDASGHAGGTICIAHEVRDVPFLPDRVGGDEVARHLAAFLVRWDITVSRGLVRRIDKTDGGFALDVDALGTVMAERVVVAAGTRAMHPRVAGLPEDFTYPWVDSARSGWERCARGAVAVVGGGDVAFDQARWCAVRGASVTLLCRSAQPRAPAWLVDAARKDGVEVVTGVRATRGRLNGARVVLELERDGAAAIEAGFDAVVAAIGRVPNAIEGVGATSASSGLAVAGDARGWRARHVVSALGDGCVAATAVLGDGTRRAH